MKVGHDEEGQCEERAHGALVARRELRGCPAVLGRVGDESICSRLQRDAQGKKEQLWLRAPSQVYVEAKTPFLTKILSEPRSNH